MPWKENSPGAFETELILLLVPSCAPSIVYVGSAGLCSMDGERGPVRNESQANCSAISLGKMPLESTPGDGLSIEAAGGNTNLDLLLVVPPLSLSDTPEKLCSNGLGS